MRFSAHSENSRVSREAWILGTTKTPYFAKIEDMIGAQDVEENA
jgi:hypothetical protein